MRTILARHKIGASRPGMEAISGDTKMICAYWNGTAPASIVAGQPVVIAYGQNGPQVATPATSSVYQTVAVALDNATTAGYYWFQTRGIGRVLVNGAVNQGAFVKVTNASATKGVSDGASRTANSFAVAREANSSGEKLISAYIIGDRVTIPAS